ncbi:MAG: T9SS type A sorting domain-containing protein [Bacteroidota bacterium]|nr:T9SS type A sorting domain-containing protein [Bacteroidota bacterium]
MKKQLLPICLSLLLIAIYPSTMYAQLNFEKTYQANINNEGARYARQTTDGGYILCGDKVIKTNQYGDTTWTKPISFGNIIKQTADGNYITGGNGLVKLSSTGAQIWAVATSCNGISETKDGGYITSSASGLILEKRNATGTIQWTSGNFGVPGITSDSWSAIQSPGGGFLLSGTRKDNAFDAQIMVGKVDSTGNTVWAKLYGSTSYSDYGNEIINTTDGGTLLIGTVSSSSFDMYLIKQSAAGVTQWTKTLGGTEPDGGYGIAQTTDGGYIAVGTTKSFATHGGTDVYLVKTDAGGTEQWHKSFGGSGDDYGFSVQQTSDGGYIIAASKDAQTSSPKMYLIKTNASGSTAVEDFPKQINMELYPNPATDNITIESELQKYNYQVLDIAGKLLLSGTVNANKLNLNISSLSKGIYFISIYDGDQHAVHKKIIKE